MKRALPAIFGTFLVFLIFSVFLLRTEPTNVSAAIATHVVISEVQISGTNGTDDEFVELYNPTNSPVDLTGWRLSRRTSGGTLNTLVSSLSGSIPAHGYFLIAHSASYSGSTSPDTSYSAPSQNIAVNNSVVLYSDAGITQVDLVGMGTAAVSESSPTSNPDTGGSVERKANTSSDATSMGSGGADELMGNGEDSDNNFSDFIVRAVSQPQNSSSSIEPSAVTATPTPTLEPTETPSPTTEPSPTPSETPSVTPSPTSEPSPSLTPTDAPSPTPSLSPTPSVPQPQVIVRGPLFICSINYKPWKFFNKTFFFPSISCERS